MNVILFFAGRGDFDFGFEQAEFNVVEANELEHLCCATYIRNHPNTEFVLGDIYKIDPNSIPDCFVKTYLCFWLKGRKKIELGTHIYDKRDYAPLFSTLGKIVKL